VQLWADHVLVSADRGLNEVALAITGRPLALAAKNTPSQISSRDVMFDPLSAMGCSHQISAPPSGRVQFQNALPCFLLQ